jgi:hypothetical protein
LAHPSRPVLVGVKANPGQACSALDACGFHSKRKEALALNPEENGPKNMVKPWFSNRELSTGSGKMLIHLPLKHQSNLPSSKSPLEMPSPKKEKPDYHLAKCS